MGIPEGSAEEEGRVAFLVTSVGRDDDIVGVFSSLFAVELL